MEPGDEMNQPAPGLEHDETGAGAAGGGSDWQPEEDPGGGRGDQAARGRETAERWLGQLQEMIDGATRTAGPVLRDVAVKAAELTAVAAHNAGPVAQRAANVTQEVGERLAARSKALAEELRQQAERERGGQVAPEPPDLAGQASGLPTTIDVGGTDEAAGAPAAGVEGAPVEPPANDELQA